MKKWLFLPMLVLTLACEAQDEPAATGPGGSGGAASNTGGGGGASSAGGFGGGSSRGGAGSSGGAGSGGSPNLCAPLSDALNDPNTLGCWNLLHQVQGTAAQYDVLDIAQTHAGRLTIEPIGSGWYQDGHGPFVYKQLDGDFVVEVDVEALDEVDLMSAPVDPYHSAGLLLRDAASVQGAENWVMYNVGYQQTFVGTERKTTVNSVSTLLFEPGSHRGRLRICRLGDDVHVLRFLQGDSDWTLEDTFVRDDLPVSLQAGMITNAWPSTGPTERNVQARFDYIRFGEVTTLADCSLPITLL